MRLRIIAVSGAAASVDRFDRTVAPAKAPTAPGTARRRTTFQSTLPKRQWEMPEASVVPSSAVWTTALAWAGRLDLEYVGFGLVALLVLVWFASVAWYHLARVEEKFEKGLA